MLICNFNYFHLESAYFLCNSFELLLKSFALPMGDYFTVLARENRHLVFPCVKKPYVCVCSDTIQSYTKLK